MKKKVLLCCQKCAARLKEPFQTKRHFILLTSMEEEYFAVGCVEDTEEENGIKSGIAQQCHSVSKRS